MAWGVAVQGKYAYLAARSDGTYILNVSNPGSVTRVATIPSTSQAMDVVVQGHYVYIADYDAGIKIYDVSTPAAPVFLGAYTMTSQTFDRLAVSGNTIWAVASTYRVVALNAANPAEITLLAQHDCAGGCNDVLPFGNLVYVASGTFLEVLDIEP